MEQLVLRMVLSGPMQSWGLDASGMSFSGTERHPTKSGITGLLSAACGYRENDPRIRKLYNNITVFWRRPGGEIGDEEFVSRGVVCEDFVTVNGGQKVMPSIDGSGYNVAPIRRKRYLADARFVVYVVAEEQIVRELEYALLNPKFCLYLGRKAYLPAEHIYGGLVLMDVEKEKEREGRCLCMCRR